MSVENYNGFNAYSEAYRVVNIVELVGYDRKAYRIEILEGFSNPQIPFTARYYERANVTVQPTYPQKAGVVMSAPQRVDIWIASQQPWVAAKSAEEALNRAMGFLAEKAKVDPEE